MCYELKETATNVGTKKKRFNLNLSEQYDDKIRYHLTSEENEVLKNFFESWREEVKEDLKIFKSLSGSSKDSNDIEDTSPTFKVLEEGAVTLSKEERGKEKARYEKLLEKINDRLGRIVNGIFGRCNCKDCNGRIMPIARIKRTPLSLWCKKEELALAVSKNQQN
jgi:RNA polymerase-binding transcription factor DksA